MRDEAELLADLLDGRLAADEVPAELAELVELAELAQAVRTHVAVPLPTPDFRAALQDRVVEAGTQATAAGGGVVTGGAAATSGTAGTAGTMAGTTGWIGSLVAGVTATAVLAGGGLVLGSAGAVPGDALYGVKQQVEQVRLTVSGGDREARLLVQQATERVREAIALVDARPVDDLLARSTELVERATSLAAPGELDELVETYAGTLRVLASRTDDVGVDAAVRSILDDVGELAPDEVGDLPVPPAPDVEREAPSPAPDADAPVTPGATPDAPADAPTSDGDADPSETPDVLPELPTDRPSELPTELPTAPLGDLDVPAVGRSGDTLEDLLP